MTCQTCDVGKFAPEMGQSVCYMCANGTASNQVGASQCLRCGVGSFSSAAGMTECSSCSNNEFTEFDGAISCMSCGDAGISFALSQPDQCTAANSVIIGSVVGGVVVVVIVALVLVLVLVNPNRGDKLAEIEDSENPNHTPQPIKHDESDEFNKHNESYLTTPNNEDINTSSGIPQPPRPDHSTAVPSDDGPKTNKAQLVPTNSKAKSKQPKKQRWSEAGSREINR